jgi:acyl dehydratase
MFDQSKLGHSFPPFTLEVERCKIHELTLAIGDENPIYHSREGALAHEYRDVPISPTTPTIFSFWGNLQLWDQLATVGLNIMRVLHGEEEYQYQAPIYPGDLLTGVTTIVSGKTRRGKDGSSMDLVTIETCYTNQQEQKVLTARTTLVVTE